MDPHHEAQDPPRLEQAWHDHRRVAFDVAYRLLGSVADAEDAVSESYARLARQPVDELDDVRAWLVVVVSRICLDALGSARARREAYVGPWLPEPAVVAQSGDPDPADRITLDETVRMALLVVLEQLSPPERVAFVLHDVFRLGYAEIGEIVGRTPESCRQLASRARRRVDASAAGEPVDVGRERAVTERFLAACEGGDLLALTEALDPDVLLRADGGGKAQAPRRPIRGAEPIIKIVTSGLRRFPGTTFTAATVNGGPGMVVRAADGTLNGVLAFVIRDGRISEIDLIGNPDKLALYDT